MYGRLVHDLNDLLFPLSAPYHTTSISSAVSIISIYKFRLSPHLVFTSPLGHPQLLLPACRRAVNRARCGWALPLRFS